MSDPIETSIGPVTVDHFRPGSVQHQLMMEPKFLYALFNPSDQMHSVTRAFMTFLRDGDLPYRRLVCNEHIVDEAATRLKKKASIDNAAKFLTTLEESHLYHLEAVSTDVFEATTDTFMEWTDLGASFTDFLVATHMDSLGIDYIATFDSHFDAFDVTPIPYQRS